MSCFQPAKVLKQHNAGKDNGTWVNNVKTSVFRSCTVSCFEDCVTSYVVDVSSWSDTDTANLCSKCIRQVVTV
ncbi:hypothetical protein D3C71_1872010 [compost metagenome]